MTVLTKRDHGLVAQHSTVIDSLVALLHIQEIHHSFDHYIQIYVCMHVYACMYMYVCMYVYMHACMYVCMYVCIYACMERIEHTERIVSAYNMFIAC